ncbi:predicted protein [Sclerotinia sclerotiorum 1980 UF-70]|uniref:Uncharacterized protein n=1 Tax=Sclerotinia sclerotiorum (strain ATCC 18683 / 1980 / Ss-1) TaxID=665079 RepID=A7F6A9_SCLS1|nr:predicted protein [Sclerotinia sclerotiorum 1980 UF-70]EDN98280.1 predicted protein [Sclerotinia sclerotiorum 1980 UF-70]
MTKMFNKIQVSKRGRPGCYECEKPEFLGLCDTCSFERSLTVVSDGWSTLASPDKKNPPPERKDPSPDANSCPQCGAGPLKGTIKWFSEILCTVNKLGIVVRVSGVQRGELRKMEGTKANIEVYVNTTQYSKEESAEEHHASSRYSKEESPNTTPSNYSTLVKRRRGYNALPYLENRDTRKVESYVPTNEWPTECEIPPSSLVRRGTQWLSTIPRAMIVGVSSLLGFRKVRTLYDEEAAVDTELARWVDEKMN